MDSTLAIGTHHDLMKHGACALAHLVKLVNTAYSIVTQNQRPAETSHVTLIENKQTLINSASKHRLLQFEPITLLHKLISFNQIFMDKEPSYCAES